jgi:hypothetical protein
VEERDEKERDEKERGIDLPSHHFTSSFFQLLVVNKDFKKSKLIVDEDMMNTSSIIIVAIRTHIYILLQQTCSTALPLSFIH